MTPGRRHGGTLPATDRGHDIVGTPGDNISATSVPTSASTAATTVGMSGHLKIQAGTRV